MQKSDASKSKSDEYVGVSVGRIARISCCEHFVSVVFIVTHTHREREREKKSRGQLCENIESKARRVWTNFSRERERERERKPTLSREIKKEPIYLAQRQRVALFSSALLTLRFVRFLRRAGRVDR
jgi:hypothetical protein